MMADMPALLEDRRAGRAVTMKHAQDATLLLRERRICKDDCTLL
jgi:hypothetical protein